MSTAQLPTESARLMVQPSEQIEARLRRAVRDDGYDPVAANAAMALSSVSVMSNALLLKRWQPDRSN